MTRFASVATVLVATLVTLVQLATAQDVVTTSHSTQIDGRELQYTAHTGLLPIRHNETGEPHAYIFFVAYSKVPDEGEAPHMSAMLIERAARAIAGRHPNQ